MCSPLLSGLYLLSYTPCSEALRALTIISAAWSVNVFSTCCMHGSHTTPRKGRRIGAEHTCALVSIIKPGGASKARYTRTPAEHCIVLHSFSRLQAKLVAPRIFSLVLSYYRRPFTSHDRSSASVCCLDHPPAAQSCLLMLLPV